MSTAPHFYLASASPRRRELLAQIGWHFEVIVPAIIEERSVNESASDYVCRLAREKASAGLALLKQQQRPIHPVLGADTIVVLGERVLEKPRDRADALEMLQSLSGKTHTVYTAIAVATPSQILGELVATEISFRPLSEAEIEAYWESGEPADKAGSYGIQGIAGKFVRRIEGSYSAVVGLPLLETDLLLKAALNEKELA